MLFDVPNKPIHANLIYRTVINDRRYFVSKPFLTHPPICLKSNNFRSLQCKTIAFRRPARMGESVTMHLMDSRVNVLKLRLVFTMLVTCVMVSPNSN